MKLVVNFVYLFTIIICTIVMTSCSSKEESVINRMQDLADKVENIKDPSTIDWNQVQNEYLEIQQDVQECQFTKKEQREYYYQEGRFQAVMLKQSVNSLPGLFDEIINMGSGYLNGVRNGLKESNN